MRSCRQVRNPPFCVEFGGRDVILARWSQPHGQPAYIGLSGLCIHTGQRVISELKSADVVVKHKLKSASLCAAMPQIFL